MKAAIYARVSTLEQEREGYSIPAQLKAIRRFAFERGITIEKEFVEAESAYKSGRPEFERLLTYSNKKGIDCIIAHKVDRVARNLDDLATLDRLGLELLFVEQKFDDSPTGKFSLGITALMAKLYSDNLSQEVTKGMTEKVRQGGFPSRAPLGYVNNTGARTVDIDPERAPLIKQAFELYGEGSWTLKTLCKELYLRGLKTKAGNRVNPSALNNILRHHAYYGYIKSMGECIKGNHAPIISKALFDRVQELLDGAAHTKKRRHFFALRGFLVCGECGCKITAERQKGHTYYRCTKARGNCSQKYVREEVLFDQVEEILAQFELEQELMELILEACQVLRENDEQQLIRINAELNKEHQSLTKKIDKLVDTFLEAKIPEDIYSKKLDKLQANRQEIEIKLDGLENKAKDDFERIEELLRIARTARTLFVEGNPEQKRQVLNIVASNLILKDRCIVGYQLREPFEYFDIDPSEDKNEVTWAMLDLNQRHPACKTGALPLS